MNYYTCDACNTCGMHFKRKYKPEEYFEGDPSSPVWIVGLNPAGPLGYNDERTIEDLRNYFNNGINHSYFTDFGKVSEWLYKNFGKKVAHTDIAKCYSPDFPPDGKYKTKQLIIDNCQKHFIKQLRQSGESPLIIICNGSSVCEIIKQLIPLIPGKNFETSYIGKFEQKEIIVILSGFIGRIDNYAKRRLGKEFEQYKVQKGIE